MHSPWLSIQEYWNTLFQVIQGYSAMEKTIDIPLQQAIRRSRRINSLAALTWQIAWLVTHPAGFLAITQQTGWWLNGTLPGRCLLGMLTVLAMCIVCAAYYGFFRLFTLLSHVMTINIFKCRGQRLRLLSLETTLLPLTSVLAAGYVLYTVNTLLGLFIVAIVITYTVILVGRGYNTIFHKTGLRGFALFMGASLLTLFILVIGLFALMTTLSVLLWLLFMLLRPVFQH